MSLNASIKSRDIDCNIIGLGHVPFCILEDLFGCTLYTTIDFA